MKLNKPQRILCIIFGVCFLIICVVSFLNEHYLLGVIAAAFVFSILFLLLSDAEYLVEVRTFLLKPSIKKNFKIAIIVISSISALLILLFGFAFFANQQEQQKAWEAASARLEMERKQSSELFNVQQAQQEKIKKETELREQAEKERAEKEASEIAQKIKYQFQVNASGLYSLSPRASLFIKNNNPFPIDNITARLYFFLPNGEGFKIQNLKFGNVYSLTAGEEETYSFELDGSQLTSLQEALWRDDFKNLDINKTKIKITGAKKIEVKSIAIDANEIKDAAPALVNKNEMK